MKSDNKIVSEDKLNEWKDDTNTDIFGEKAIKRIRDIGTIILAPRDLLKLTNDPPSQPLMRNYPSHFIGKKERQFNRKWYDEH